MFYIVETPDQVKRLLIFKEKDSYVEVIQASDSYHPKLSSPIALYIRPLDFSEGFILPIDHPEGLGIPAEIISKVLSSFGNKYVYDKKAFLYHFSCKGLKDIQLMNSLVIGESLSLPNPPKIFNHFYNKHRESDQVNKFIPLSKLYERAENNFNYLLPIIKESREVESWDCWQFYNDLGTETFFEAEQHGLRVAYQAFIDLFSPQIPEFNIRDNVTYTYYNLYNVTSRPTNAFNSVNFAAIPHKEQHRKAILPQNDLFVEFDFDGYHLRLLAQQIGYTLTEESAHKQLARLYFEKEEITDDEYSAAKQINFQALYGKIPAKYRDLDVFKKIQSFIDDLWSEFETKGYVEAPISKRRFTSKLERMNPQKLMNYVMQNLETSRNILILKDVLDFLKSKKTKIALYTYDAILFDFSKEDGKELLETLENLLGQNNLYPVKFKYSKDYCLE
jgi:hypothetical protein